MPRLAPGLATLLVAAASASAQPADQSAIIVTGAKPASRDAVREFVHQLIPVATGKRLGRFERSVCPVAFGLPAGQQDAVERRIRLVARAAGVAVGGAKCAPNVVLIVASNKPAVMEELRRRHPDYFGELSRAEIRRLVRSTAPGVAWQLEVPPSRGEGGSVPREGTEVYINRMYTPSSRITVPVHAQFAAAVVVVDRQSLAGLTVTQLADYAAIRALTGADPATLRDGAPTVLEALEAPFGQSVPVTMTQWDLAYLRGYYDARRNLSTAAQRSAIAKKMTGDLQQPQPQ